MKLFFKSIGYSVSLIFKSSGIMLLIYFTLNILSSTITLFTTLSLKYIIDSITVLNPETNLILLWLGLYILSIVLTCANNNLQNILYDSIFKKAEHLYECNLAKKLMELPLSVIDSSKGRDIIDDVKHTKNTAIYTTFRTIRVFTLFYTFVIAFLTLVHFHLWFSFLFLIITIPGVALGQVFDKKAEKLRLSQAPDVRKLSYYRWMLTDAWPAKDVRMYNLTNAIKQRYKEEKDTYIKANKKLDKIKLCYLLSAEIIRRAGEIAFTIFVVFEAINGNITLGDIALYVGFALTVSNSFSQMLFNFIMCYTRSTKIMGRLFGFLEIKSGHNRGIRPLSDFESLSFDNVYFKYPYTDKYVLSGASFTLNKGEKLSLVGINGSGKSTLIKLMLGLYEIESGQILINGYPISDYDVAEVRKMFSVLFQNFVQYPLKLRDNVALSDIDCIDNDEKIEKVLLQSGILEDIKLKLENGLDSFMTRKFDEKGTELSKGQWQKLAVARTYFKNAQIIVFDEPSAALDAEAEDAIFKNFELISENRTGIMISHRISSARLSDKVIVIDSGKIVESGTHEELISINGLYAKLYNLQREKYAIKEAD